VVETVVDDDDKIGQSDIQRQRLDQCGVGYASTRLSMQLDPTKAKDLG
jgi:hypothetical protein